MGEVDPVYHSKINTIAFDGVVAARGSQLFPLIAHDAGWQGPVSWTFSKAVNHVEFDLYGMDVAGGAIVKVFDENGKVLTEFTNTVPFLQHFLYDNAHIASVTVSPTGIAGSDGQVAVDSIQFSNLPPIVDKTTSNDINGLLWGYKWDHTNLTYSFPVSAFEYNKNGYEYVGGFEALNAAQKTAYASIIANFGDVCGLNFTATTEMNADIRFGEATSIDYSDGKGAHAPGPAEAIAPDPGFATASWGDVWFDHGSYDSPSAGNYAYFSGLMHELGHAVGLKHGHAAQSRHGVNFPKLPESHNSFEYSVMTYHQFVGDSDNVDDAPDHPTSLMQNDIAALQYLYGADYKINKTDTTYKWDAGGQMLINGVGQGTPVNGHTFLTIWDGGGKDTYDLSDKTDAVAIDLEPGGWTTFGEVAELGDDHHARGNVANALLYKDDEKSLIENAKGGAGGDVMLGNQIGNALIGNGGNDDLNGGDGNDKLTGNDGDDELAGGDGKDTLTGNDGADSFVFNARLNGRTNVDEITDFSASDIIELSHKVFDGLRGGFLRPSAFFQGAKAHDANDRVIYNDETGTLFFDADGKGGAAAVKFAQIDKETTLDSSDFLIS